MLKNLRNSRTLPAYLFLLPAVAVLALGLIVPLVNALQLSFQDWSMGTPWEQRDWIGLESYARMFKDEAVRQSLGVTLRFAFWVLFSEMILGIGLALLLEKPIKGAAVFRTLFILPLMVSPVAVGLIWRYLYDGRIGIINHYLERIGEALPFLQSLGFSRHQFLGDPALALPSIIVTDIWQWTPFIFIIILAGLQALPSEVMEASRIDGANWFQMTVLVKLPMLRSIILVTFLMRIIDVFRALEVMYVMTFGGPGLSTELLSLHIYKVAFTAQQLGFASTIAVLLMSIILIFAIGVLVYQNPLKERADF
jgi:multiple sugar transport system permease protein